MEVPYRPPKRSVPPRTSVGSVSYNLRLNLKFPFSLQGRRPRPAATELLAFGPFVLGGRPTK